MPPLSFQIRIALREWCGHRSGYACWHLSFNGLGYRDDRTSGIDRLYFLVVTGMAAIHSRPRGQT